MCDWYGPTLFLGPPNVDSVFEASTSTADNGSATVDNGSASIDKGSVILRGSATTGSGSDCVCFRLEPSFLTETLSTT